MGLRWIVAWGAALQITCCGAEAASTASVRALPVPAATINPGEVIGATQLTERDFQTSPQSLSGIATDAGQVVGKETRRRLMAGKPIALAGLGKPLAVRRGAAAVAFYRDEGFSISTPVIALDDGSTGDVINARATATGAVIQVEVMTSGELTVIGE